MDGLQALTKKILAFRDERDWEQFHTPRNIAAALAVEVGELQEAFLWKNDKEVQKLLETTGGVEKVREEVADVMIYCLLLAHACGIDPEAAIHAKIAINAEKYPVNLARSKALKYSDLRGPEDKR